MLRLTLLLLAFAAVSSANADRRIFEVVEHAAEVPALALNTSRVQVVYAKRCDECPTLALSVNEQTRIYDGKSLIPLSTVGRLSGRGGTLFFDPESRVVTRIIYWPSSSS